MAAREDGGGGTGSARRRRERRLRAHLKYARMSVAMALAKCHHDSAQRQRTARAREEEREMHYTAAFRTTVPPPEPELFDLFEEPNRVRPNLLLEPHGVQDQLQRHRVEQALDVPDLHMNRDEVDEREYDIMEEVVQQLVPRERAQLRTFGEDGAALVSGLLDGLEKLVLQERVQPRTGEQAHVHFLGLLHRIEQRTAEQVVHVPLGTVSESLVEQVVDVSTPSVELVSVQDPQLERPPTRAAASSLDAPQEHFDWVFSHYSPKSKKCKKCWQNQ